MKAIYRCGIVSVLFSFLVGCAATQETIPMSSVLLQPNLGEHRYPISTSVPLAQRFFDQGLILSFWL